ncbi:MAG: hypothetical protein QXL47_01895 [Candidatus Anstonellales archaeon]
MNVGRRMLNEEKFYYGLIALVVVSMFLLYGLDSMDERAFDFLNSLNIKIDVMYVKTIFVGTMLASALILYSALRKKYERLASFIATAASVFSPIVIINIAYAPFPAFILSSLFLSIAIYILPSLSALVPSAIAVAILPSSAAALAPLFLYYYFNTKKRIFIALMILCLIPLALALPKSTAEYDLRLLGATLPLGAIALAGFRVKDLRDEAYSFLLSLALAFSPAVVFSMAFLSANGFQSFIKESIRNTRSMWVSLLFFSGLMLSWPNIGAAVAFGALGMIVVAVYHFSIKNFLYPIAAAIVLASALFSTAAAYEQKSVLLSLQVPTGYEIELFKNCPDCSITAFPNAFKYATGREATIINPFENNWKGKVILSGKSLDAASNNVYYVLSYRGKESTQTGWTYVFGNENYILVFNSAQGGMGDGVMYTKKGYFEVPFTKIFLLLENKSLEDPANRIIVVRGIENSILYNALVKGKVWYENDGGKVVVVE